MFNRTSSRVSSAAIGQDCSDACERVIDTD